MRNLALTGISVFALWMILSSSVHATVLESFIDGNRLQGILVEEVSQACRVEPRITVDIRILNPRQIRQKPRGYDSSHTNSHGLQGLAYMEAGFEVSFVFEHISSGQNPVCVRIRSMEIRAGHEAPLVWLRPELVTGSCEYKVTLEHELEHVNYFQDHLRRFRTSILHELPVLVRYRGYSPVNEAGTGMAEKRLEANTMKIINVLYNRSMAISDRLDEALDSPEEYRRLSNLCR